MIPKIIWQTYKCNYEELPQYVKDCATTWKEINPEWEYRYMSDKDTENFVLEYFGIDWYNFFIKMPYGVMRADIWRYMIIFIYGGVYADLDTICKEPIENWLLPSYDTVISMDTDEPYCCQYLFASIPQSLLFKKTLDLIQIKGKHIDLYETGLQKVYNITGPIVWTEGVRQGLGVLEGEPFNFDDYFKYTNASLLCYGGDELVFFNGKMVEHLVASKNWTEGYNPWQIEVGNI
jgi:mannosyltransferase OCH1-like enzyme